MKHYDSVMIGFGKASKTLAAELALQGEKVAVVEQSDKMYGGTCINVGCIPTKSMIFSAEKAAAQRGTWEEKRERYAEAVAEKNRLVAALRAKNYAKLHNLPNVEVIDGRASFADKNTLTVEKPDGSKETVVGTKIFINTGSKSFVPPIKGVWESKRVYTSDTLLDLTELPKRLVIVGGGFIGLEFASYFSAFGSSVTVVSNDREFLPREDREIAAEIFKAMSETIEFRFAAETREIRDSAGETEIVLFEKGAETVLKADAVLIATGRRPNIDGLNLENAGVETARGAIKTDERLKTTAENIWAAGDVKGGLMFTYLSLDDYRILKSRLLGDASRTTENRGAIPYCSFFNPPFARIGLTEAEAQAQGFETAIGKLPASAIPKAHILKNTKGLLKAVVDKKSGRILGASLFCEESHEMINLIKTVMDAGLPYTVLRDQIFTHPTMSESLNDLFSI